MAESGQKKIGGRKKGVLNRKTKLVAEKAEELGCDPFEILCRFAMGDWKALGYKESTRKKITPMGDVIDVDVIDPELRMSAAKEACQYIHAKRRSIEIDDNKDETPKKFVVLWADEDGNDTASTQAPDASAKADQ